MILLVTQLNQNSTQSILFVSLAELFQFKSRTAAGIEIPFHLCWSRVAFNQILTLLQLNETPFNQLNSCKILIRVIRFLGQSSSTHTD